MWKYIVAFFTWLNKQLMYRNRLESKVDDIMRRTLRLEIFDAIRRNDTRTVYELHDVYVDNGWNSYVTEMVNKYKNKHSKKDVK